MNTNEKYNLATKMSRNALTLSVAVIGYAFGGIVTMTELGYESGTQVTPTVELSLKIALACVAAFITTSFMEIKYKPT